MASKKNFTGTIWHVLPFVNVMHDGHDFTWERESRIRGHLNFELQDLVCVILPVDESELRERMEHVGIAAIAPEWNYEEMIGELARQQRKTKKIWKDKLVNRAAGKGPVKLVKAG